MTQDFEEVKAYLKRANGDGQTLYDHLCNLLLKINKDKPEDVLSQLEAISVGVKNAGLTRPRYEEQPATPATLADKESRLAAIRATLALFDSVPSVSEDDREALRSSIRAMEAAIAADEEDGGKAAADALLPAVMKGPHVPNLMAASNLLEWGGVKLGREEMFKIELSLKRLTTEVGGFQSVRFFGKIFGTKKDYFIAEGKMVAAKAKEPEDKVTKKEPRGVPGSANEFVYFASNSLEGKWDPLPDVLPEQIITARAMRRFFTGELGAPVLGYPRFPAPEFSYLRAQIARIAAATLVSPKGFFTMEEPEEEDAPEEMKEDPEFEVPGAEDLATSEGWCHHRSHILKMGRCKKWEAPEEEEEEEEEPAEEEEEEEEEEPIPMLNGLDADESKIGPLWKITQAGGQHTVTCVHSLMWPGATTVGKGKQFSNVYVGWGQQFLASLYTPPALPAIATEYVSGFNPEEAEEDETDPMLEQIDPAPPKNLDEDGEGDEGDEDGDY